MERDNLEGMQNLFIPYYTLDYLGIILYRIPPMIRRCAMERSKIQARAKELEQQISALPAGSVTKKTVNGKDYFYHRWTENKKRREKYIPADELENFRA